MGSIDTFQCGCVHSCGIERLRYFPRQMLTADDMRVEQDYFREKQRRHNRFMHGWGVVCGLLVQLNPKEGPLALTICPGYALGPCGDEIYVPEPVPFDMTATAQLLAQPSCANNMMASAKDNGLMSIDIRYADCEARPVRTLPAGCGCDDSACEFTRIRDGFEIRAHPSSWDIIKQEQATSSLSLSLCEIQNDFDANWPSLPAMPTSDWVRLALIETTSVTSGANAGTLSLGRIHNELRRILYSTTLIQNQVRKSCNAP